MIILLQERYSQDLWSPPTVVVYRGFCTIKGRVFDLPMGQRSQGQLTVVRLSCKTPGNECRGLSKIVLKNM